ncbi:MAG: hydrogenase formation protein HypD [Moorellales bacterium]
MAFERFRDAPLTRSLLGRVRESARTAADRLGRRPVIMEVCGTHTVALSRYGLRAALADLVELKSGPGCPVCVTDYRDLDTIILMARVPGVTIATFGDLVRVPGSFSTLEKERARGAEVLVFYSPADAVAWAGEHPDREVVFVGVGFETTTPAVAAALEEADQQGITNFSLYSAHKLIPPVMRALVVGARNRLDAFLLPGHVSTVIGRAAFDFLTREFALPAAVTGFEPLDLVLGLKAVLEQLAQGRAEVTNCYPRVVKEQGNPRAREVMDRFFLPTEATWRGIGPVPDSGLALRPEFAHRDAGRRFPVEVPEPRIPAGCRCGELLQGNLQPPECPLFGRRCTPEHPVGPCMVSSEGACAAYYLYEGNAHQADEAATFDPC